jgi:DnaJ-class molecular chaperone
MQLQMAVAVEARTVERAQFGAPVVHDVACPECLDTGHAGGSAWTGASRCEACRGPGLVTRVLRAVGLGEFLAAPPREWRA